MESGIGSGLGLGPTEPVGDAAAGENQLSPRAREPSEDREDRRRRKEKEPEKTSANDSAEEASRSDAAGQSGGVGVEEASAGRKGEDERPPHRVDSLA